MLYLAPNKKIFGIFGDGRQPLPFYLFDSHDPKNPVSEVPCQFLYLFIWNFNKKILWLRFSCTYCSLKKQWGSVHLHSALGGKKVFTGIIAGHQLQRNELFYQLTEIGPKSCILCLWKRMTLTWLLLTCLKHQEWEPSHTPKFISRADVGFLEISSVPTLHLLSSCYFTTSVKTFVTSCHRKEFPFGKAILRVGWLSSVEKRWNT